VCRGSLSLGQKRRVKRFDCPRVAELKTLRWGHFVKMAKSKYSITIALVFPLGKLLLEAVYIFIFAEKIGRGLG
jgi:hypothetical protein